MTMNTGKKKKIIRGARVLDPARGIDEMLDVLIEDGQIAGVDKAQAFSGLTDSEELDARGLLLTPGLIDIHAHFREPGQEWKETVETGSRAAVAGGFSTVCCMPNTKPVNDNASVTKYILQKAGEAALCRVLPIGAITLESSGLGLSPMGELIEAGCVAFSDDGRPVMSAGVMRKALEYSLMFRKVLTVHEEDLTLSEGFSMNESALSLKLGLKGMPDAAENVMISRDIELARLTGGRVHFCHVSTTRGVMLIRRAKEDGIPVTAEVTPHNFTLDESVLEEYDTNAKMSMPLRGKADIQALLDGLREGVIDCIASDHAPHEPDSKNVEFDHASFGILGLQTMLPLTLARVRDGSLTLPRAIEALTTKAAQCLSLPAPSLSKGSVADICLIDLERRMRFSPAVNRSKSRNSPFFNWELQGLAVKTFVAGKEVFSIEEFGAA